MADTASRLFYRRHASGATFAISDKEFLLLFNSRFPLPQDDSWQLFHFSDKLSTLIFSELRQLMSMLGSWLRITTKGSAIGRLGPHSSNPSITWIPCSPTATQEQTSPLDNESNFFVPSLDGSGEVTTPSNVAASGAKQFNSRYVPSERHLNWMENPTQHTEMKADTGWSSSDNSKDTNVLIPRRKPN
jgi:hypothetical protein